MSANTYKNYFTNFMSNLQPLDLNNFKNIASKNMEAITAANQVWMEGMQVASKRQAEAMQQSAQRGFECFKNCVSTQSPQDLQKAHAEYMHEVAQKVSNNAREIMEMSAKASLEIFDILNKRVSEVTNEICCACQPQKAQK